MNAFLIALQFLTRLPVPRTDWNPRDVGRSLIFYPCVGLVLGGLIATVAWLSQNISVSVAATLVLICWVALTGALHLDGLADSADAWAGAPGNRERTLEIMKDPRRGAIAIVVIVLALIAKFATLQVLIATQKWEVIASAPVLGRVAVQALLLTTPYVRHDGLGAQLAENHPSKGVVVSLIVSVIGILLIARMQGLIMIAIAALTFWILRVAMLRRIDGTTGDTAGATIELVEVTVAVVAASTL